MPFLSPTKLYFVRLAARVC